jgi:hypothetical protein
MWYSTLCEEGQLIKILIVPQHDAKIQSDGREALALKKMDPEILKPEVFIMFTRYYKTTSPTKCRHKKLNI